MNSDLQSERDLISATGKRLDVGGFAVGAGKPTFVIAEIGVNHDGSLQKAIELVKIAHACGADAVKLQVFRATSLMHTSCTLAAYQKDRCPENDAIDMLRKYELSRDDLRAIVKMTSDLKMIPLATPFSPNDIDTIAVLCLPAIKIASPDLVNRPLLETAVQLGKPMLLSTGAATMAEVHETADWLADWSASYAFLHCVSAYPTQPSDANLCWIGELDRSFDAPIGYSDHTTHPLTGALAVAAGATIIEKHLTYDSNARGPDHSASADPQHFERYVKSIREADTLRGKPGKTVLEAEKDVRTVSRQSLVLRRTLQAGEAIRPEDLTVQRPGTGVPASMIGQAIGRRAITLIQAGAMLQWDMLADAA